MTKYSSPTELTAQKGEGGKRISIFDAARKYAETRLRWSSPPVHEYGTGSSRVGGERDAFVSMKAVVASFERIHRSNLVGMGVLPLQFLEGTSAQSLGLDGSEKFSITGLSDWIETEQQVLEIEDRNGQQRSVS